MNEHLVAGLHRVGGMAKVMSGHALEHRSSPFFGAQSFRHFHQAGCRDYRLFCVGSLAAAVSNNITLPQIGYTRTDSPNNASAFHPIVRGKGGPGLMPARL